MKFTELKIRKDLLSGLAEANYEDMTDIQNKSIPSLLEGRDGILQSPTGTGKTCTFVLPTLEKINTKDRETQVLVLCPTRELAMQTTNEYKKLGKNISNFEVLSVYGGQDIRKQIILLKRNPQVIVSTPGRLLDLIKRKALTITTCSTVVLDEADEMLDMGFEKDLKAIMGFLSNERQTILLSATLPTRILKLSAQYQNNPVNIKADLEEQNLPKIDQYYIETKEKDKFSVLYQLLTDKKFKLVLIFTNMKIRASKISRELNFNNIKADCIHSDLRQNVRDKVMKKFRANEITTLVATDVAARGIDVSDVDAVINYDMPENLDYYIHRIGRTARNKKSGEAYTLISKNLRGSLRDIEKATKTHPIKIDIVPEKEIIIDTHNRSDRRGDQSNRSRRTERSFDHGSRNSNRDGRSFDRNPRYGDRRKSDGENRGFERRGNRIDFGSDRRKSDGENRGFERSGNRSGFGSDRRNERSGGFERRERSFDRSSRDDRRSSDNFRDERPIKRENEVRYFINVGRKDGIRDANGLIDVINFKTGLKSNQLHNIKVLDAFCFVNVDKNDVGKILKIKGQDIKNRRINIEETKN